MKILNLLFRILTRLSKELPLFFISTPKITKKGLIVSFTSYPARLSNLHFVVRSLLRQSVKPEKIILYLGTDTKPEDIPDSLKKLQKFNFEIKTGNADIKPHKKYFFAMQEFPKYNIVTVDDDIIYHKDFLKDLYNSYLKNPSSVHARRVTKLTASDGNINKYEKFIYKFKDELNPSHALMAIGCGGVLYPAGCFKREDFNIPLITENCLNTDDIYLKFLEIKNNVKVVYVPSRYEEDLSVRNTQKTGLFHSNYESGNKNDLSFENLTKAMNINIADYL